jgi:hypothetical protein
MVLFYKLRTFLLNDIGLTWVPPNRAILTAKIRGMQANNFGAPEDIKSAQPKVSYLTF